MGRSRETSSKKDVRNKKEKKRKDKEKKKQEKKSTKGSNGEDDMIAYVDEYGNITSEPPDLSKRVAVKLEDIEIGVPKSVAADPADSIRKGIVAFFNDSKGYGFIKDLETQQTIFVHANGLIDPIKENNKVTFEVVKGHKGPNAVNVKLDK